AQFESRRFSHSHEPLTYERILSVVVRGAIVAVISIPKLRVLRGQFCKQRFRFLQVGGVEALGEPVVDFSKHRAPRRVYPASRVIEPELTIAQGSVALRTGVPLCTN